MDRPGQIQGGHPISFWGFLGRGELGKTLDQPQSGAVTNESADVFVASDEAVIGYSKLCCKG
jgi:hypothetical protein